MDPSSFRDLVSGRQRGPAAALARFALGLVEPPYTLAVAWRNQRYDRGRAAVHRVPAAVVSVGNLTLGGTGKTPMVEWIAGRIHRQGVRVAIVSRGYGAGPSGVNDEALELAQRLPDVPHVQNPDRVRAAERAIGEFGCELIVLDDAFQHRRLARDLDIVLLDALEPFGFGHVFPRGTLREPAAGLRRAQVVALARGELLPPDQRERIREEVHRLSPQALWLETTHAPRALRAADGSETPLDALKGQSVAAFCGIGNPAGFRHTLAACGYEVAGFREFSDHHRYAPADVAALVARARRLDAAALVCTCKDLVKLRGCDFGTIPLWAISIELAFLAGQADFERRLEAVSGGKGKS
jgi:tetraacyldisaccharide 4'-kinase